MSRQNSNPPTPDIYTALLFVGAASMITACAFLFFALQNYGFEIAP